MPSVSKTQGVKQVRCICERMAKYRELTDGTAIVRCPTGVLWPRDLADLARGPRPVFTAGTRWTEHDAGEVVLMLNRG